MYTVCPYQLHCTEFHKILFQRGGAKVQKGHNSQENDESEFPANMHIYVYSMTF